MVMLCVILDTDMGARHRARASTIQIIKVQVVEASKTRRANIKQFHVCVMLQIFNPFNPTDDLNSVLKGLKPKVLLPIC